MAILVLSVLFIGTALGRLERLAAKPKDAATAAPPAASDIPIYAGGLAAGWQDWSWARHDLNSRARLHNGRTVVRMDPEGFQGVYFHADNLDTTGLTSLWVWVHGGISGGQRITVCAVDAAKKFLPAVDLAASTSSGKIPSGYWTLAIVSLGRLQARDKGITGFVFQDVAGKRQPSLYLADMVLKGAPPKPPKPQKAQDPQKAQKPQKSVTTIRIEVDTSKDVKPISPLIYGLAGGSPEMIRDLRIASLRWGGNPNTRYNWEKGNCWNAARDWEFRNGNYGSVKLEDRLASGVADQFAAKARSTGAAAIITIPTIGYVARDDDTSARSMDVPKEGGSPVARGSEAISGYDPSANQRRTSIKSYAHKRGGFEYPPDLKDNAVYQDEWVAHLVAKFGRAASGGVRFYAMDNEPDLWSGTHTDIHPVRVGYDDLLSTYLEYASAIKAVDPTAQVTGPVSWGWTGYFHSPRDQGKWTERPDRKSHGDMPLIPWFLDQVRRHDQRAGRRTLDVLDIHYYPQGDGVFSGKTDPVTNALRLRSTRGLWDPSYRDESWIAEPVNLVPLMRAWIAEYYPGTKLGITEWNWGADNTICGGLAAAECLGVFGREGVYIADYWTAPAEQSPGYFAFKMFRNADGAGRGFGDRSVRSLSSAPEQVSSFASIDSVTGEPIVIIINKQPDGAATVDLTINGGAGDNGGNGGSRIRRASVWRYDAENLKSIVRLKDWEIGREQPNLAAVTLPPYSITLLRLRAQ